MEPIDHKDSYISDSEAFSFVIEALDNVAAAPTEINLTHRDQFEEIVNILNPFSRSPRDDALLVTTLKALTGAISKINTVYHASLLHNIYSIPLRNYEIETRKVILDLIINLAAVPDKYLNGCLEMLVDNFVPSRRVRERYADKLAIRLELYQTLDDIAYLVPLAPLSLREVINRKMPRVTDPKEVINSFVKCMLELANHKVGEIIGSTLLRKVVELLVDVDVNIKLEDIPKEDIFEFEPEDGDENACDAKSLKEGLRGNAFADKLDSLMVIVCEYLDACASNGCLKAVFDILSRAFLETVMNAYKTKFAQFVMFYACSLDPEDCGKKFAFMLRDVFVSDDWALSRMSSISYLASYLVRANFIPTSLVAEILQSLLEWCLGYYETHQLEGMVYPESHRVFYSGCQAVMYILCYHMRSLLDADLISPFLKLESVLHSSFKPLKVCLPIIVDEFACQSDAANLFQVPTTHTDENLLESRFSKAFGGNERLDMFFPFDPYGLKESDRFIRPIYNIWRAKTCNYFASEDEDVASEDEDVASVASEDEDVASEDEELDAPEDDQLSEDDDSSDNISEKSGDLEDDDDIEITLDQMSITPANSYFFPLENKLTNGIQMPARIRPSVSP